MHRRLIVVLALFVVAVAPTPAAATFPGANGDIVYLRFTLHFDIAARTIQQDGTGDAKLAQAPAGAYNFSASGDGTKLVYTRSSPSNSSIGILDLTSGDTTKVIDQDDLHARILNSAALSPDGTRVVVCSDHAQKPYQRLYVVGVDGSNPTKISGDRAMCSPDWSSTDRIAAAVGGPRTKIFTLDPDGGSVVRTVLPRRRGGSSVGIGPSPSWAPDGSSLVFVSQANAIRTDVWIVDDDGTDLHRLIKTPRKWDWVALHSPDGSKIAVSITTTRYAFSPEEIWIYDADGSNPTKITHTRVDEYLQTWLPA
jgi:Tol biopolymer transport system component